MIGIIVSGHGKFGSGIYSAVTTLTGYSDNFVVVDYDTENDSLETLEQKFLDAKASLSNCSDIIVLCDILGGTPFKVAVTTFISDINIKILYGTNVGMAMKLCMNCMSLDDTYSPEEITEQLVTEGTKHIGKYEFVAPVEEEVVDGI